LKKRGKKKENVVTSKIKASKKKWGGKYVPDQTGDMWIQISKKNRIEGVISNRARKGKERKKGRNYSVHVFMWGVKRDSTHKRGGKRWNQKKKDIFMERAEKWKVVNEILRKDRRKSDDLGGEEFYGHLGRGDVSSLSRQMGGGAVVELGGSDKGVAKGGNERAY